MKPLLAAIVVTLTGLGMGVSQGAVIYSDSFNRDFLGDGSFSYTTTVTAGDGAAEINGGLLQLSNDGSGAANANGRVYVTTATSAFGSPYSNQLNQNPGLVTWSFNMRQIRTDPSGFDGGNYGLAFVLGASSGDLMTANGYAIVLGQSGATDPIRLVRFTSGLDLNSNLQNIISGTAPVEDIGDAYLSLQVTYNPVGDAWSLYGRNDGTSGFADPVTGSLTFAGSASDATYTAEGLSHLGFFWNYSTVANQTAFFDNISLSVIPEPAEWGLICALGLLGVCGLHTWRERRRARRQLPVVS